MYEYKIKLDFKVESCTNCPFRREIILNETVESMDKLTGVICITRRQSMCMLKNESVFSNEIVEAYGSNCPLKGNVAKCAEK